jgi:hypothetical protein
MGTRLASAMVPPVVLKPGITRRYPAMNPTEA